MNKPALAAGRERAPSMIPEISVVVCTYNRYDVLPDALGSLADQTITKGLAEVIVIDNSSDKRAQEAFWLEFTTADELRVFFEAVPGLSRARNRGAREASAPVVAYLDDDAIASPNWCSALVRTFKGHPAAGIVGGPVRPIWPAGEPEWLHPWQRGFFTIVDHGSDERSLDEQEWLAGTNIAFRREALLDAGGFAESLGRTGSVLLSNEELDISERLRGRGLGSYYNPAAEVFHRVHADRVSRSWMRRRVAWQAVSDLLANKPSAEADEHWRCLSKYFLAVPPEMRTVRSLFLNTADPVLFQKQCDALQAVLHLALQHGEDPLGDRPA